MHLMYLCITTVSYLLSEGTVPLVLVYTQASSRKFI